MKSALEFFKLSTMKKKKILDKVNKLSSEDMRKTMQKSQKLCKPYVQTQYRHQCSNTEEYIDALKGKKERLIDDINALEVVPLLMFERNKKNNVEVIRKQQVLELIDRILK